MDELIKKYDAIISSIIDGGTYVGLTWTGVLFEFAQEMERLRQEDEAWNEHAQRESYADYHML